MIAIRVEEEDYLAGLKDCKTDLHGRIILSKGDKPLTHLALTKKVAACVERYWTVESNPSWEEFL